MSSCALAALLILGQIGTTKSIRNADSLLDRDWSNDAYALSLHEGDRWTRGSAWFFRYDKGVYAWKGKYNFYPPTDPADDVLILRLGLVRKYELVRDGEKYKWILQTSYEPQGTRFEIPLNDSRVPDRKLQFSVTSGYWVDATGEPVTRSRKADGLLGALGLEEARELHFLENVQIGDTLELSDTHHDAYLGIIESFPPPGFRPNAQSPKEDSPKEDKDYPLKAIRDATSAGRYSEAIAKCDELLQTNPGNYYVWFLRGGANVRSGNLKRAHQDYSLALLVARDSDIIFSARASVSARLGNYAEAVADYRKCVELKPEEAMYWNDLAWSLAVRKEFSDSQAAEALDCARRAGGLTAYKDAGVIDTLAAAYARLGIFESAVRAQREAVRLADDADKANFTNRLRLYESRQPYIEQ